MRINQNISAMNTYQRLTSANNAKSGSLAKLSSGLRINKAGDDAAGLAISEKMRGQIGGLKQASRNAQDGISLIQTAEGALSETHSILGRMRDLTVQSANDTNTKEDREAIQEEIKQLHTEITSIANRTEFNGQKLLGGTLGLKIASTTATDTMLGEGYSIDVSSAKVNSTYKLNSNHDTAATELTLTHDGTSQTLSIGTKTNKGDTFDFDKLGIKITLGGSANLTKVTTTAVDIVTATEGKAQFQIGANKDQNIDINIGDMTADGTTGLKVDGVDVINGTFEDNLKLIDDAIATVSEERSKLGSVQNRLDHTINNLTATTENLSAAESRIRDVDMAQEMMEFTKNNILSQAATSMLAQANQMPQSVLQLLQ